MAATSWSSWYNQPTAQLYHVNTDNDFPYRVCGGQQESGSACVSSRGNDGQITFREWHPVGVEEYGYAVPDPRNPDIVYGGKITRYDRRTAQNQNISPVAGGRGAPPPAPGQPVVPHRPHASGRVLAGRSAHVVLCEQLPLEDRRRRRDLEASRRRPHAQDIRAARDDRQVPSDPSLATQRGVIYSIAPSYVDINRIWIGTDDGVDPDDALTVELTWKDVTPPGLTPWMKVFNMDAGRFDARTAYAAVNTLRLDDMRPHLWRTHDGGATWTEINTGIGRWRRQRALSVRIRNGKDCCMPRRSAGCMCRSTMGITGNRCNSNMAASSVRDIIVKDDDLIAATHGRGFWILDDVTPLRQLEHGDRQQRRGALQTAAGLSRAAGTRTPTRRCPRRSRVGGIRPRAPSSTTT